MNTFSHRSAAETQRVQNAYRVSLVAFITLVVSVASNLLQASQTGAWQLYLLAGFNVILGLVCFSAMLLSRRGRARLAVGLVLVGSQLTVLAASAIISGIGLTLGAILMIGAIIAVTLTLTQPWSGRLVVMSAVVALIAILTDLYGPAERVRLPELQFSLPIISIVLFVPFLYFLARQFTGFSLRTKLIILFLGVTLAPVSLLSFVNYQSTRDTLVANTNQSVLAAAAQTRQSIDTFLIANLDAIRVEAQLPTIIAYLSLPANERPGSAEEATVSNTLRSLSRRDTLYISSYAILDQNGLDILDTFAGDIGVDKSNRDYFQVPVQTGLPYVSPVEVSRTTEEQSLYFSALVRDAAGTIIGVLRVRFNGAVLQQLLINNNGAVGEGSFATLLDENYIRLAHGGDASFIFKSVVPLDPALTAQLINERRLPERPAEELSTNLPAFASALAAAGEQPFFSAELHNRVDDGEDLEQAAVVKLVNQPWYVVYGVPQAVALAPVEAQSRINVLLAAGVTVAVAVVAILAAQLVAAPINRLTSVAEKVRGGDLETVAAVESQDEIGTLADTFNAMTAQLRSVLAGLEQRVADRTRALALSAEVSRRISSITSQTRLVTEVVEQMREAFNFYHVHIYLFDGQRENLVMVGGTGEAGRTMLGRGHQIARGRGLVGRAADTNLPILVSDVSQDPNWLANPLLPETQSELAVPIAIGDKVMGVLDVQQNTVGGLKPEDSEFVQSIANQVAIALQNTRSYAATQKQADQEALINAINQKIQNTESVETALQVAAREIGRALNIQRTRVQLAAAKNGHQEV